MARIAIVGAGAKAAAIVARAAVLRDLGIAGVPDLVVFEKAAIASTWTGDGGHSNGFVSLCTPAEKDVGFPYDTMAYRRDRSLPVAAALFERFSWQAFLVAGGAYSDWVDRGRPHPSHRRFARYLAWVFETARQPVTQGGVSRLRHQARGWRVELSGGEQRPEVFDGVVLTGAGRVRAIACSGEPPVGRRLDAESFWPMRQSVLDTRDGATVAVVGDGGAAGAIVAWLIDRFAEEERKILNISPMGTLFPRGDGYAERRWFSDPTEWRELSPEDRRKLIDRTEAGVVSLRNKQIIDASWKVNYLRGRAESADWSGQEFRIRLAYGTAAPPVVVTADVLVSAIGFDTWSLIDIVEHEGVAALRTPGASLLRGEVEADMSRDLSMPASSGLPAGLHVPGLAGLAQGPGMANLGCLGLMAAAVLDGYL